MKTVLIVDDVPEVTTLLKAQLERTQRFKVIVANGGKEGLRVARTSKPDIVISDIDMPDLDGGAFAAQMGQDDATKRIPLIFLSTLVTPRDENKSSRFPMVSKSSPVEVLIAAIDQAIGAGPDPTS
jgi:CheY-like chemotaxis protein